MNIMAKNDITFHLGFREVVPDEAVIVHWRSMTIETGAAQSTLQDIKVPEYGGCYIYKNAAPITKNRYIYWRICHDVIELWEESLNVNLKQSHLQLKFTDAPILEGLSVHESDQFITILLATISSVHCLRFQHPAASSHKITLNNSIFADMTYHALRELHTSHLINTSLLVEGLPHTASTYLEGSGKQQETGIFVLGQNKGSLLLIKMTLMPFAVHCNVMKTSSLINRFITGFVPTLFRGGEEGSSVSSMVMEYLDKDVYTFGICFDGRLRVWSCSRMECILAYNCLENTAEFGKKMISGTQRHLIRSHKSESDHVLAVFLSYTSTPMILLFSPKIHGDQLSMELLKTLYPPQYDLIDIALTSMYVWSLWTDANNETQLLYTTVASHNHPLDTSGLKSAFLEAPPDKEIHVLDPTIDAAEICPKRFLSPYTFSAQSLLKALSIYKRNIDFSSYDERNVLDRKQIVAHIEMALVEEQNFQTHDSMEDDEVATIRTNSWATFYSHALQYYQVGRKAIGIVDVGAGGLISIIRKKSVSWIRPIDALELLLMGDAPCTNVEALVSTPILYEDASLANSVIGVARPLITLRKALYPEVIEGFNQDLYYLEQPDQVAANLANSLLAGEGLDLDQSLTTVLKRQLSGVQGIVTGIQAYMRALQLDLGNPDALTIEASFNSDGNTKDSDKLRGIFSSNLGASVVSAVVYQLAHHRMSICRDLLLLEQLLLKLDILSAEDKNKVLSNLISQSTILTQAYFALAKLTEAQASIPMPTNEDISRRQIAVLSLTDCVPQAVHFLNTYPATTLELFVLLSGGKHGRSLVASNFDGKNVISWDNVIMPLATTIAQLAWPISKCLVLPEFLVWEGQHCAVQEYVRLLKHWCEWNSCSRKFLRAISLLNEGEAYKAQKLFMASTEGVATEEYLGIRIAGGGPETTLEEAQVQYFLKVIRLLDQSGHPALALQVANTAVTIASNEDPGLPALYSVAFKFHLELEQHNEAFTAMMACPDEHRRRNCLRQLIITLYDRKCLSSLVGFNYGILENDVINILENRARSADILVNNYYDLLFAFHARKHHYKKAAWVMYECAQRLNIEGLGEEGLKQQAKCYLACLNCLRHISANQVWILKPLPKDDTEKFVNEYTPGSLKHLKQSKKRPQFEVLEYEDINKEYELVHARIKLQKTNTNTQVPKGLMDASDTIALLAHSKLYKDAVRLCALFELPVDIVLEGLASVCVSADRNPKPESEWQWLSENGIHRDDNNGAVWWSLMKDLLREQCKSSDTTLYSKVAYKIIQMGHSLPAWLADDYKRKNCAELVRLYLHEGLLEEATHLACSYIDGLLSSGTQQMGLPNALHLNEPAVYLPYNTFDHLTLELEEAKSSSFFKHLHGMFNQKMKKYQSVLTKVSQDILI